MLTCVNKEKPRGTSIPAFCCMCCLRHNNEWTKCGSDVSQSSDFNSHYIDLVVVWMVVGDWWDCNTVQQWIMVRSERRPVCTSATLACRTTAQVYNSDQSVACLLCCKSSGELADRSNNNINNYYYHNHNLHLNDSNKTSYNIRHYPFIGVKVLGVKWSFFSVTVLLHSLW